MMTLINGHQVAYTDEGKGPPLVFVHGFPLNRSCWSKQVECFKSRNRVIALDLPGFGASEAERGPATMNHFAEGIFTLCQYLQTGPIVLVGHSMGGYIALAFAQAYPVFLRGLVLVGTRAGRDEPEVASARRMRARAVQQAGIGSVVTDMAPKMLSAINTDLDMARQVRDTMASSSSEGVVSALLGMADRPDRRAQLASIQVPTLVVAGADDTLIPMRESVDMAETIPEARLVVIPKAGHLVAYEQPGPFNEALASWLDSSPRGRQIFPLVRQDSQLRTVPEGVTP
ncbi:alpha/beta hydrolase [Geothrix limicola]|uniref:Alpha/beta hydrolase n=1 Tax=Geothrix limicola TaxID=2927978 RepID=A0ABQ5QFQ6_9BACT|nr:alpha/beta hydrolase [Geothrix limicola]GLH73398.1 alpha/beta hydrolase [Geothrix limicola]